jgi:hypothetical protein
MDLIETISTPNVESEASTEGEIHQSLPISSSKQIMESLGHKFEGFSEQMESSNKENQETTNDDEELSEPRKCKSEAVKSQSEKCFGLLLSHDMVFDILLESYFESHSETADDKNHICSVDSVENVTIDESDFVRLQIDSSMTSPLVYYEVQFPKEANEICHLEEMNDNENYTVEGGNQDITEFVQHCSEDKSWNEDFIEVQESAEIVISQNPESDEEFSTCKTEDEVSEIIKGLNAIENQSNFQSENGSQLYAEMSIQVGENPNPNASEQPYEHSEILILRTGDDKDFLGTQIIEKGEFDQNDSFQYSAYPEMTSERIWREAEETSHNFQITKVCEKDSGFDSFHEVKFEGEPERGEFQNDQDIDAKDGGIDYDVQFPMDQPISPKEQTTVSPVFCAEKACTDKTILTLNNFKIGLENELQKDSLAITEKSDGQTENQKVPQSDEQNENDNSSNLDDSIPVGLPLTRDDFAKGTTRKSPKEKVPPLVIKITKQKQLRNKFSWDDGYEKPKTCKPSNTKIVKGKKKKSQHGKAFKSGDKEKSNKISSPLNQRFSFSTSRGIIK